MASPHPPVPVTTPPLHSPIQQSPTPPPRPPSAPSVYAPRPVRVPAYRPVFSRPMFISEGATGFSSASGAAGSGGYQAQARTSSPLSTGIGMRRSSSASISSITAATSEKENDNPPRPPSSTATGAEATGAGGIDGRSVIYSPTKDALEELYKIMRRSASSTSPPVGIVGVKGLVGLPARSPGFRYGHRRDASDASDSSLSGAMSGLLLGSRLSPDATDMRPSLSPVARTLVRNPMVRDPSFNREPSPNLNAPQQPLQPMAINPIISINLDMEDDTTEVDDGTPAPIVAEVVPPTPIENPAPEKESQQQQPPSAAPAAEAPDVKSQ